MDKENKTNNIDAEKCADLLADAKKNSQLFSYLSVAIQSYMDGLKTACRCQQQVTQN